MDDIEYSDHLYLLRYHWNMTQDIETYPKYEIIKDEVEARNPEIIKAWKKYKKAVRKLDNIL